MIITELSFVVDNRLSFDHSIHRWDPSIQPMKSYTGTENRGVLRSNTGFVAEQLCKNARLKYKLGFGSECSLLAQHYNFAFWFVLRETYDAR
jgi:hypothetical protein